MENINDYLQAILNNNRKMGLEEYQIFKNIDGIIRADILNEIIDYSISHKCIRNVLRDILEYCNHSSVTPEIFDKIAKYPHKKMRKDLLISLAHCSLSIYQLWYICKKNICFEAFAQLLDIYLINDCFTVYDLNELLEKNKKYLKAIDFTSIYKDIITTDAKKNLCKYFSLSVNDSQ